MRLQAQCHQLIMARVRILPCTVPQAACVKILPQFPILRMEDIRAAQRHRPILMSKKPELLYLRDPHRLPLHREMKIGHHIHYILISILHLIIKIRTIRNILPHQPFLLNLPERHLQRLAVLTIETTTKPICRTQRWHSLFGSPHAEEVTPMPQDQTRVKPPQVLVRNLVFKVGVCTYCLFVAHKRKQNQRMVTILIQDVRSGTTDHQLAEVKIALRSGDDPQDGYWADARELVSFARVHSPGCSSD